MTDKPKDEFLPTDAEEFPTDREESAGVVDGEPADIGEQVEKMRDAHDKLMAFAQRAQADLVNYRRRAGAELEKERIRERQRFGLRCAEIVDQLEAALQAEKAGSGKGANGELKAWLTGVRAVYDNFVSLLASEGFERFDVVGERFDPTRHEAIGELVVADGVPGTIAAQLRSGCTYKGEVIRPALVQTVADDAENSTENKQNGT